MPFHLKKIKLAGFKSFVDPTILDVPSNRVGIVGPNGCGKSNVIDAIRWVLGESSASKLRGDSLTDVIFSGSSTRKPVSVANVELIFDNSDGSLKGPYASYSEISIKRQGTREGESFHFLNGTRCRRKDIKELFLGTGLGARSYSIIEQGMISRVIEAKPEELRVFVEEVAGIALYKTRRHETETRIRHTRENLNRLNDVRQELEKQLERLNRQAESAQKYHEYKKEHDIVEQELLTLRWGYLEEALGVIILNLKTLETHYEKKQAERTRAGLAWEKLKNEQQEESKVFDVIQAEFYRLGEKIAATEQNIKSNEERKQEWQQGLQEANDNNHRLQTQLSEDNQKLTSFNSQLETIHPEMDALQEQVTQAFHVLNQAKQALEQWNQLWEGFQKQKTETQSAAEIEKSKIEQFERKLRETQLRLEKLNQEKNEIAPRCHDPRYEVLEKEVLEKEAEINHSRQKLNELHDELLQVRSNLEDTETTLNEIRTEEQSLRGRQSSLEALQQAVLKKTDTALQRWFEVVGIQNPQRLGESITVESGYEIAVETALGSALEAVTVEGWDKVFETLPSLMEGQVFLMDGNLSSSARSDSQLSLPWLTSKITTHLNIHSFLEGVYVSHTLDEAIAFRSQLKSHESIVTKEGIWIGLNWVKVLKGDTGYRGFLQREAELKTLAEQLKSCHESVLEKESALENYKSEISSLEEKRESLLESQHEFHHDLKIKSAEFGRLKSSREYANKRLLTIDQELDELNTAFTSTQEDLGCSRTRLEKALNERAELHTKETAILGERDQLKKAQSDAQHFHDTLKHQLHEIALKKQGLLAQSDAVKEGIARLQINVNEWQERVQQFETLLNADTSPIEALKEELQGLLAERLAVEERLNAARRVRENLEHQANELELSRQTISSEIDQIRDDLEKGKVEQQTLQVRGENVREKLQAYNANPEEIAKTISPEATEEVWEKRLSQLVNKIERLGAINLAAIEEFNTESERKTYLDMQNQDLTEALETLEAAIRKIDKETRALFQDTFDKLNAAFQGLFPKLFPGGHAYIELTGDELLESGVVVMARPPGKRNTSIHLLSGGEKALVAIALVFALFQLNPAPFCVLDEVDAPLDDANIGRFCNLVQQLSSSVQFIYITHNKIAMEMANHLIGVTMKEPGVSRLVSVNVEEAVELAIA